MVERTIHPGFVSRNALTSWSVIRAGILCCLPIPYVPRDWRIHSYASAYSAVTRPSKNSTTVFSKPIGAMMCGGCRGLAPLLRTWQRPCAVINDPSGPPGLASEALEPGVVAARTQQKKRKNNKIVVKRISQSYSKKDK